MDYRCDCECLHCEERMKETPGLGHTAGACKNSAYEVFELFGERMQMCVGCQAACKHPKKKLYNV